MDVACDTGPARLDVCVLLPVYNDWPCFPRLLAEIDQVLSAVGCTAVVVIANDGGDASPRDAEFLSRNYDCITEFRMLDLVRNVGNQNALTIGLSFIRDEVECEAVVVMDSDGEDKPSDLSKLLSAHRNQPADLIVAERSGRSEGLMFRLCYRLYRLVFIVLIGKRLTFGNFSVLPRSRLRRLCSMAELPVSFAATLIKSRVPVHRVPCAKGVRYDGVTSQNFVGFVIHAVNSILVFGEVALVRITMLSAVLIVMALIGIALVGAVRLFTDYAIAGWASDVVGILVLLIGQGLLFSLLATLVRGRNPIGLIVDPERYKLAIASATLIRCANVAAAKS